MANLARECADRLVSVVLLIKRIACLGYYFLQLIKVKH